jgi:thiol-disulfide isomerase/thioredoxin
MRPQIKAILRVVCGGAALVSLSACFAQDSGTPAPRFTAKTMAGERFNNEAVKGKVVLLQFWTTWCGYCRREQPLVDAIDREFSSQGLLVLAVDVGESKKKVQQYLERSPRVSRIVLNEDTNLPALFAANAFPVYVVIDREGNVAGIQRGAAGERGLRRLLSRAGLEAE